MATVIIGAGVGGLSAAIALASRGEAVSVIERQGGAGGKMLPVEVGGRCFDSGPTVLTMRWVFDELLSLSATQLDSLIELTPLRILARHYWTGGKQLDLHADYQETLAAIGTFAGQREAQGYADFAAAARRIHHALLTPFLKSQRPTPWGLFAAMPLGDVLRINPFETLWHALGRYFRDRRLQQLFGRYATYCGSSPFSAPATLMLVADVEASGVWRVAGGMAKLAKALQGHAERLGVGFHFGRSADRIEIHGSRVAAVIDGTGMRHPCPSVIVNADSAAIADSLFGATLTAAVSAPAASERSLSAITWCATTREQGVALEHHTVFFSDDYAAEFAALKRGPALDPTVYVCDQHEGRKLILVNAPATGADVPADIDSRMITRLARCGLALNFEPGLVLRRSPKDFAELYPATAGALYGRATHGWMSTFQRPQARTSIPGLYLAGGSTHPGPGVPMAALAGMRAAEAVLQDRASMRR